MKCDGWLKEVFVHAIILNFYLCMVNFFSPVLSAAASNKDHGNRKREKKKEKKEESKKKKERDTERKKERKEGKGRSRERKRIWKKEKKSKKEKKERKKKERKKERKKEVEKESEYERKKKERNKERVIFGSNSERDIRRALKGLLVTHTPSLWVEDREIAKVLSLENEINK